MDMLQLICFGILFWGMIKITNWGFFLNTILILFLMAFFIPADLLEIQRFLLLELVPLLTLNTLLLAVTEKSHFNRRLPRYSPRFKLKKGKINISDIRRGVAIIGAAGSGKTESVVYNLIDHFRKHSFCGIMHDYKNFELTELAYPLYRTAEIPFYILSFDQIIHRVNPIAPRYLPDEESVNEVSRVLLENLLEQKESLSSGNSKFFNDAAEGLICGLIWKLKTDYPDLCTLPHLITLYQHLNTQSLVTYLSSDPTSKAMANAFLSGVDSERQTAAVKSTLANAFKKINTKRIFMALSADEVPLNINDPLNPAVISIVNNPKFETAYSPAIATVIHTISKQMSIRKKLPSFILLEEAPTIRLLNMHRIPATLRSYDIATIYVMQDKIQNDLLYGEKASKAILSNLSYQFFGKVNDPDTAKYYERFFEIVKRKSISTSQSEGLNFDTRITKSEREVSKIRADRFFRLQPGEFVAFADGKDQAVCFNSGKLKKQLPILVRKFTEEDILQNYVRIQDEIKSMFTITRDS
ncbi:type IV secretory system conjugative DNA transfer family protein [Salinimicrobium catena]